MVSLHNQRPTTSAAVMTVQQHPLLACGDVGILSDENAQRLCSIFSEAAWSCLSTLRSMSARHGPTRFRDLYLAGLSCVRNWNADVVREEVVRMQAQYPEADTVFQYVYILLIKEVGDDACSATGSAFPPIEEAYHVFLCRLCACPDVCGGETFFNLSLLERRIVYIECFRNALHDVLRRRTQGRPAMGGHIVPFSSQSAEVATVDSAPQQHVVDVGKKGGGSSASSSAVSSFREAVASIRNSEPLKVTVVDTSNNDDKCIEVSRSPCFFEDGEDVDEDNKKCSSNAEAASCASSACRG